MLYLLPLLFPQWSYSGALDALLRSPGCTPDIAAARVHCCSLLNVHLIRVEMTYANALLWLQIFGVRGPSAGPSLNTEWRFLSWRFIHMLCNATSSDWHLFPVSLKTNIYSDNYHRLSSAPEDMAFFIVTEYQHPAYCNAILGIFCYIYEAQLWIIMKASQCRMLLHCC